MRESLHGHYLG